MRKDIHPKYVETTITCACGNVVRTKSTVENLRVEICANCHPFYTGKQKLVDTAGMVEKYRKRYRLDEEASEVPKEEVAEA